MSIGVAFKAFFKAMFNEEVSQRVQAALETAAPVAAKPEEPKKIAPPTPPAPARSEALTLLAVLQREARFIDFIQEPLDGYPDAQIGAAARDVHRASKKTLERLFAFKPVVDLEEGSSLTVAENHDAERYRLTGNVSGKKGGNGTLMHHGWEAAKCELPQWTGHNNAARVIAPAEVELK